MNDRIDIQTLEPQAYQAMFGLEKYLGTTELDPAIKQLIRIRASQINGCAYCIQMHAAEARKQDETEQRLYALAAWQESPLFDAREQAVLALTDAVTKISDRGLDDKIYERALEALGENGLAQVIMQIVTINAWNRIAVATHMQHR